MLLNLSLNFCLAGSKNELIFSDSNFTWSKLRDYVRGGAEGALAPPEFEGLERGTEGKTDNPLLIAPSESKS